jgi:hypothetical protein
MDTIYLIVRWTPQIYVIGAFKKIEISKMYTSSIENFKIHGAISVIKPLHMDFYPKHIYACVDIVTQQIVGVYAQPDLIFADLSPTRYIIGPIQVTDVLENVSSYTNILPNPNHVLNVSKKN